MALGFTPQERFDLLKTLTDIFALFKELQKDPTLAAAAKDAFALSEREKSKAEEARGLISKYENSIVENRKQLAEIEARQADLDKQANELKVQRLEVEKAQNANDARARQLDRIVHDQANMQRQLDADRSTLTAQQETHRQNVEALNARKKEVDAFEAELKETAQKLKGITGSL